MPAFITNTQFLVRYDYRWVAKQVLDTDTVPGLAELQGPTGGGAVLAAFIEEASDLVMSAAAIGQRYSLQDVITYGGSLLVRIVSDLTMGLLLKRRARASEDLEAFTAPYKEALDYLELLRRAERIFSQVPEVPEAGVGGTADMTPRLGLDPPLISQNVRIFGTLGCERRGY